MSERLSILDTMFVVLEQTDASAHMHIGAALVFDPLPDGGRPDVDLLRELIDTRIGMLPRFAQRLSSKRAGPLTWLTWEPADGFSATDHVRQATLPAPGGEAELCEWLGDFWSHRLDRSIPLWEMTLLDGLEDDRWVLATKTHHCLVDGVGSLDIGDVLLDTSPDAPLPPPRPLSGERRGSGQRAGGRFWLTPQTALGLGRAGAGALRRPIRSARRVWAAGDLVVRDQVIGAPPTSLNQPLSGTRDYAVVRLDLDDVQAVRDRRGGTVNDVVLAVCAGGLRDLLVGRGETPPPGGLRAQVPVNIRRRDRKGTLGNELTSLFIELPVDEPDPVARFERVLRGASRAKGSTQRIGGKTIVEVANMGPPLAGEILAYLMFGMPRMFNLTITNVPGPRESRYVLGAPLVDVLPLVPLFAGHAVGIAAVSYGEQLTFGLNVDRLLVPDVAVLAEGIERSFAALLARGSSPSVTVTDGGGSHAAAASSPSSS